MILLLFKLELDLSKVINYFKDIFQNKIQKYLINFK